MFSDKVKVFSIDRFPLTSLQRKTFHGQLSAITAYDVGQWLSNHTQLMPDSLQEAPAVKKLYALAHQGVTGEEAAETVSWDAFPHLIKNGHFEGARQFFESYPDIVERLKISPKELAFLAMGSGNKGLLEFIVKDIAKMSINDLFSPKDIMTLVRGCFVADQLLETHKFVFQNYDMEKIGDAIKASWACEVLAAADTPEVIDAFHTHVFPLSEEMLGKAIESILSSPFVRSMALLECQSFSRQVIADQLTRYLTPDFMNARSYIGKCLKNLIQKGVSYTEPLPTFGNPLLFYFPYIYSIGDEDEMKFQEMLQKDARLLDYKNRDGLNILQFIQKSYLEGKSVLNHSFFEQVLQKNMAAHGRVLAQESYQPFVEEFGLSEYPRLASSPFADPSFRLWRGKLEDAMSSGTTAQVLNVFRQIPDQSFLFEYRLKNINDYYASVMSMQSNNTEGIQRGAYEDMVRRQKVWLEKFTNLIQWGTYKDLFPVIDTFLGEVGYGYEISELLRQHMPSMLDISKENTLAFYKIIDLIPKPAEFLEALKGGKMDQRGIQGADYALFKDENLDLVQKVLERLYPNPMDIVAKRGNNGYTILENVVERYPFQEGIFKAILQHCGVEILKHLSNVLYRTFLYVASNSLLDFIAEKNPEIFSCSDEFLRISITRKKFQTFEFFSANLDRLKKLYNEQGIPLIFSEGLNLIPQLVQTDPSILNLKSREGLGVEDLLQMMGSDHELYEQFRNFIGQYGGNT
jgi:hypothetical protein